ncbi:MAG: hypothetical protein JWL81_3355 [Verrucomicrobiales bacterium]|nr:hypothetical protein [Verrucomicrobiales bacterium]
MRAGSWWQGADLNRRPKAYESSALPLSYPAVFRESEPEADIPKPVALSKGKLHFMLFIMAFLPATMTGEENPPFHPPRFQPAPHRCKSHTTSPRPSTISHTVTRTGSDFARRIFAKTGSLASVSKISG